MKYREQGETESLERIGDFKFEKSKGREMIF